MNISSAINRLIEIKSKFGNLEIVGGYMTDDSGLDEILVLNTDSVEIFPKRHGDQGTVGGVYLT